MKETAFLKKNVDKWKNYEVLINEKVKKDPDTLAELFIELTDDLSYSRTFYPGSKTTAYLNSLTSRVHQLVYKTKKEPKGRLKKFWGIELPLIIKKHHKKLLASFIIFFISMLIGIVSTSGDDAFVRLILGDSYVNMTLENIEKGDPMAVYKEMNQIDMLFGITFNNIRVSFFAFIMGLLLSVGTGWILFFNGVMLGSFQYFFFQKGLLIQSILTIWIHGTLEISAIIIAGGAGIVLGNSILFPGTFSRKESLIKGANDGIKIIVGLIPIFIVAGFLESFVTRYTQMPSVISLLIILSSLFFIIYYFVIYPVKISKRFADE